MSQKPQPAVGARTPVRASGYDVVAVGSSAGGLHSLEELLGPLPANFPCAVLITPHLSPNYRSLMPELLERRTHLEVRQAHQGEAIQNGVVYIAAPNLHLLVEDGTVRLGSAPALHHQRPSIDLLFDSVARHYKQRAIAVVLSGSGRDGADGIRAIKGAGGATLAEDPASAAFNSMPQAAIATACVDQVLPASKLGGALMRLCEPEGHAG